MSHSLQPQEYQHSRLPLSSLSPLFNHAVQPSHPLLPPSPFAFNLSQHWGLFHWVSSLPQMAKILKLQLQQQSFWWIIQDWFPLGLTGWISLQSEGLSRVSSNTTVQKHQFFNVQLSLWSNISHDYWKNYSFDSTDICWQSMSLLFNMLSRLVIAFLPLF